MFFLSSGPCAVNMLEHGGKNQTTTNKCFLLPTAAILEQITKGLFDSRRPESYVLPQKKVPVFLKHLQFLHCVWTCYLSFSPYQVNEGVSVLL